MKSHLRFPLALKDLPDLIPHAGDMCLWEQVLACSDTTITCSTTTHLKDNHPLHANGTLSHINLVEYGAQAIAIHGGLLALNQNLLNQNHEQAPAKVGYIASIKKIQFFQQDFTAEPDIFVLAELVTSDENARLYQFEIQTAEKSTLCSGQVLVMFPSSR